MFGGVGQDGQKEEGSKWTAWSRRGNAQGLRDPFSARHMQGVTGNHIKMPEVVPIRIKNPSISFQIVSASVDFVPFSKNPWILCHFVIRIHRLSASSY